MTLPDTKEVQGLFDSISVQYDKFNALCSLGRHVHWRNQTLSTLRPGMRVLDLGTGTGDLAIEAARRMRGDGRVVGLDISREMLKIASEKAVEANVQERISWVEESAQQLPLNGETYDLIVSGFVLRNLHKYIHPILEGVYKSLSEDGMISFVDLTEQRNPVLRFGSRAYMQTFVRLWGRVCFKNSYPVEYLQNSMQRFFRADEFIGLLKKHGFSNITARSYWMGAVTLYQAGKSK